MHRIPAVLRLLWRLFYLAALLSFAFRATSAQDENAQEKRSAAWRDARKDWLKAGSPDESSLAGQAYLEAAVRAGRPDLVEELLASGDVMKKILPTPRSGQQVRLHVLHSFSGFHAHLQDEMFSSFSGKGGWLARRLTRDAIEVWTSRHGWLFDRRGQILHEAIPPRGDGWGRQWYGAFLPDGRWVTTDLEPMDGQLAFFSSAGQPLRTLSCEQLAAPPADAGAKLIGWARSDRRGSGWVVNVGSEEGWATVWVGPRGPARVLRPGERWDLCYPRALGPRGTDWGMSVPSDDGQSAISRGEAGHGPRVGFPTYTIPLSDPLPADDRYTVVVPNGNYVFGFWPGKRSFFLGAEGNYEQEKHFLGPLAEDDEQEPSGLRTRKMIADALPIPVPIIDKTLFFDASGKFRGWLRGRRLGDAASPGAMLFRMTADSRIITLAPDLRILSTRRFVWTSGAPADAVTLWGDLQMGLFIRGGHLVLAGWTSR